MAPAATGTEATSLVLDLATQTSTVADLESRLPTPFERLRLDELKRLGPWRAWRRLRSRRFARCVLVVNDLRAQPRWLSIVLLGLAARTGEREFMDPAGGVRPLSWFSALARELPHALGRGWRAARVRRRVRSEIARLGAAGERRPCRPRRVAFLRTDLAPPLQAGGSVAHIRGVVGGFEQHGCQVSFLTPDELRGLERNDPRVHLIPLRDRYRVLPELPYLAYNLDVVDAAIEIVRRCGADLIYHRHALGSYAGARVARACGLPLVLEYNGPEVWIARHWGHGLAHAALFEEIERRALQAADLVVAVSAPLADTLRAAGVSPQRVLVNPNGVDAERYDAGPLAGARGETRRKLGIAADELVVGFVGTFGPWHGAEVLAAAAARVESPWSGRLRYLFIGDGPHRAATERLLVEAGIARRAHFVGLVPQEETPRWLAACDICASPHVPNPDGSPFFGSPTKLFEYLASGRPVIASRLGQIAEVLRHSDNAWMVPPGDAAALARGLVELARDPELRSRLGEAGRRDARTRHSWRAHVGRILERLASPAAASGTS